MIPPALWAPMVEAPRLEVFAPLEARAAHIAQGYRDVAADTQALDGLIQRLPRHHSKRDLDLWRVLGRNGETVALAMALIEAHYDPAYLRSGASASPLVSGRLDLADIGAAEVERGALALKSMIAERFGDV